MDKQIVNKLNNNSDYAIWIAEIKAKIQSAQVKASFAVNSQLVILYWEIGKSIVLKQESQGWGHSVIHHMSKDIQLSFPHVKGFSERNLRLCRQFYLFFGEEFLIWQQAVAKLPWGHIILIMTKIKDKELAFKYINGTLDNSWSRSELELQLDSKWANRHANAITNFKQTLPKSQSGLVRDLIKSPYNLAFLELEEDAQERIIEQTIIERLTDFMLELGKGFAFVGRQYRIEVDECEYYLDLLFYHLDLRCFVVLELKSVEFQPEFAGKMNFYLSAVDDILRKKGDKPSIGIILCKSGRKIDVEYALRDVNKPIGVSNYTLMQSIPKKYNEKLPTVEEFEQELVKYGI